MLNLIVVAVCVQNVKQSTNEQNTDQRQQIITKRRDKAETVTQTIHNLSHFCEFAARNLFSKNIGFSAHFALC